MPLIQDHPRVPPGGHRFPDSSGFTIRAKSIPELLGTIALYRTQNALPPGDPAREVEQFYAMEFPWLISNVGTTPMVAADPVNRWLLRQWRNPPKEKEFAESENTSTRMAICRNCEHYVPEHPFTKDDNRRLIILGAGKLKTMGACRVHHWACGLAVLIEKPGAATPVENCWAQPEFR
jgi:hypothetical protein